MFQVPEELSTQQAAGLEQLIKFANVASAASDQLIELNVQTARAANAELVKHLRSLASAKDGQELLSLQGAFGQSGSEKGLGYARAVFGWATESQMALSKLLESQVSEVNKLMAGALDRASKSAPTGSEFAFAAARSALSAANQAYDALSKAGKQVMDVTEATVSAATPGVKAAPKKAA